MIVILTGAGISKASGLTTFRDKGGIWTRHSVDDLATPQGFARDPDRAHAFYNQRRRLLHSGEIVPNAAHFALAQLEAELAPGTGFLLITQNVDRLHELAGSRALVHMHGELAKIRCESCKNSLYWEGDISTRTPCPACGEPGYLRPDVVWFEEKPMRLDEIYAALRVCTIFAAIGTSGEVFPAAGFVRQARHNGAYAYEINTQRTKGSDRFDEHITGPAVEAVPRWIDLLRQRPGLFG